MNEQQHLPADLGSTTPGPGLAALLDGIELSAVPDEQVVGVLQASWRQVSHAQARYLAALVEVGRREPARPAPGTHSRTDDGWRALESAEWCCNEISSALAFTARRADTEYQYAVALLERLPQVWAALLAGQIDLPKARLFADYLADLTDAQIAAICARLLPQAPRLTTGQLAHRLLRAVLAVDPGYAGRRYRRGVRERGVWGYLAADGTAVLSAHGLPPGDAAAAAERLEQLAAAIRAGGHPHSEQQLRADLFLRLLDGRFTGLTSEQIVEAMLAEREDADPDGGTNAARAAENAGTGDADAGGIARRPGPTAGSVAQPPGRDRGSRSQPAADVSTPTTGSGTADTSSAGAGEEGAGTAGAGTAGAGTAGAGTAGAGTAGAGTAGAGTAGAGTAGAGTAGAGTAGAGTAGAGTAGAGTADAGTAGAGTTDAETTDSSTADSDTTDITRADLGAADLGAADVGAADVGAADGGAADGGAADGGAADGWRRRWWRRRRWRPGYWRHGDWRRRFRRRRRPRHEPCGRHKRWHYRHEPLPSRGCP